MSGKLDQSLDEILTSQRRNNQGRRRSQRRPAGATRPAAAAPAGGVQKTAKPARNASKPTPAKGAGLTGESKIMVSNLVSRAPEVALVPKFAANIATAQGCFRSPDQGMLLPVRPFMPSDFRRHVSSAAYRTDVLSSTDSKGCDADTSALESDCHMIPKLLPRCAHVG